ncbi:MAG: hypothetical protein AAB319_01945, partial [Pseudomonadota bacterium]
QDFKISRFDQYFLRGDIVAKPNFQFEKRQKEIAKKKKHEEKLKRKQEKNTVPADEANPDQTAPESVTPVVNPDLS